ncbi:MAG: IS4 family transposase [Chitinispirillales bacterium]|jgi:hypothetical protein|nr:IS4 family transposase [Chitinispirillales bacterium]
MKPTRYKYSLLSQVVTNIPECLVQKLARKHGVDKQARTFSPWSHLVSMLFAHLSHALSLNDVCDALRLHSGALSTLRGATPPSRNGLSHANKTRSADLAEDIFYEVLQRLTRLYPKFGRTDTTFRLPRGLKRTINLIDSTTIQLFANCMDWAKHRRRKAAAKCHMVLDAKTFLPRFALVKSANSHDAVEGRILCNALRDGEIVVFDRAYVDYKHLFELTGRGVLWVTRAKTNMSYRVAKKLKITNNAIVRDVKIKLEGTKSKSYYPEHIRLITADVVQDGKAVRMEFITNNFSLAASTITELYKSRWDIELFFKQIKQTLKLSDFLGYSENAVKWQIWTALENKNRQAMGR